MAAKFLTQNSDGSYPRGPNQAEAENLVNEAMVLIRRILNEVGWLRLNMEELLVIYNNSYVLTPNHLIDRRGEYCYMMYDALKENLEAYVEKRARAEIEGYIQDPRGRGRTFLAEIAYQFAEFETKVCRISRLAAPLDKRCVYLFDDRNTEVSILDLGRKVFREKVIFHSSIHEQVRRALRFEISHGEGHRLMQELRVPYNHFN